ncbi:hypothetical protein SEA_DAUBENSKI_52 [Streptomyces phage Daubenski]|uniref:Uncharacterized protein n=1 Tax=Streptomyces phage Daubenski TaxID=2653725 RepID=A0A5Q2WG38_9CAUD|nr:hypothetical protein KNU80_gp214 [Streptomyces phage Daubenski]QGH76360.1 hypothetical protein SEA_DAUBENSKI_52 [Streptomyces phage Daubenski]
MSFDKMKVDELRQIADDFAVDIDPKDNKSVILTKLMENGVTWDYYQKQLGEAEEVQEAPVEKPVFNAPVESADENKVLLRMTRENGTFQVRGVTFTRDNPYAIVKERDADFILEKYEGFRIASPKEVREFYS